MYDGGLTYAQKVPNYECKELYRDENTSLVIALFLTGTFNDCLDRLSVEKCFLKAP